MVGLLGAVGHAEAPVPPLLSHVSDQAGILRDDTRGSLERQLASYQAATGHQFAFLSVAGLQGEAVDSFAIRVAEQWKLGDTKRDDGLILIVARDERKIRIEVGYGLEGAVPDALAARIIRHQISPAFKAGDYDAGIQAAFSSLMKAAEGEAVQIGPAQDARKAGKHLRPIIWLLALLLIVFLGRGGGRRGGPGMLGGLAMGLGGRSLGGGFGGGGSSGGW